MTKKIMTNQRKVTTCTRGRNGKGGKLLRSIYIYLFCVSTCDDNNPFSVSSVFRFFRYIYNRRTDGKH